MDSSVQEAWRSTLELELARLAQQDRGPPGCVAQFIDEYKQTRPTLLLAPEADAVKFASAFVSMADFHGRQMVRDDRWATRTLRTLAQ